MKIATDGCYGRIRAKGRAVEVRPFPGAITLSAANCKDMAIGLHRSRRNSEERQLHCSRVMNKRAAVHTQHWREDAP